MKITVIGDIHGHTRWKSVLQQEADSDRVIFLGDYVDSFHGKPEYYLEVLNDVIALKESDPQKYVLLLGNHDFHYLTSRTLSERYSGFSYDTEELVGPVLRDNIEKFQIMHREGSVLFSHAGVSDQWVSLFYGGENQMRWSLSRACQGLNLETQDFFGEYSSRILGMIPMGNLRFNNITGFSYTGNTTGSSPLWIRPDALTQSFYHDDGIDTQVVGHTQMPLMEMSAEHGTIYICDSMYEGSYLVIEDGKFSVHHV